MNDDNVTQPDHKENNDASAVSVSETSPMMDDKVLGVAIISCSDSNGCSNETDGIISSSNKDTSDTMLSSLDQISPVIKGPQYKADAKKNNLNDLRPSCKRREKKPNKEGLLSGELSVAVKMDTDNDIPAETDKIKNRSKSQKELMQGVKKRKITVQPPKISEIVEITETSALVKLTNMNKHGARLYMSSDQGKSYTLVSTSVRSAVTLGNLSGNTKYIVFAVPADEIHDNNGDNNIKAIKHNANRKVAVHFITHPHVESEVKKSVMVKKCFPSSGSNPMSLDNSGFRGRNASKQKNATGNVPPMRAKSNLINSPYSWKVY